MRGQPFLTLAATLLGVTTALTRPSGPRFYPDDPVWTATDTQDASHVKARDVDLVYDMLENSVYRPGDRVDNVRAQNLNTIDEVPDSTWFVNRADRRPLTVEEITRGPNTTSGPAPGPWIVTSAKTTGIMPGFTMRDSAGVTWFVKFDPPGHLGMATGTEVLTTKLLWALGYHVPENHIARVRRDQLIVGETASVRTPSGRRRMRPGDLDAIVRHAATERDGAYRVVASKRIEGKPLGPFRFYGTRRDDPNDYVAHEHRRELRGYGAIAAWLNHVDPKSLNTFDALVTEGGRTFVRHYLLDFGSTIGSAGIGPREPFEGAEYLIDGREALARAFTFGFPIEQWRTEAMYRSPAIGAIPADDSAWDPERWKPRYPNAAFERARADDEFWAASKLQALTPDLLEAAVRTAEYTDAEAEREVLRFLIQRKRAILRRYLNGINPVRHLQLDNDGLLTFENAAVEADVARPPRDGYRAVWYWFDNDTGGTTSFGETRGSERLGIRAPTPLSGREAFIKVEVAALDGADASWTTPVHAWFRRDADRWALVGFERLPGGNAPTPPRWSSNASAPTPAATH
jgi:hypothetical protein